VVDYRPEGDFPPTHQDGCNLYTQQVGEDWSVRKSFHILSLAIVALLATKLPLAEQSGNSEVENPAVAEVLALHSRINTAALNGEAEVLAEYLSSNFVASDPSNSIRHRDDLIALFSSGQVSYGSFKTNIDYAEQLGEDLVVIMGTESSTQTSVPSDTGLDEATVSSTLNRRFTNVYRREDGIWRLLIKQSTIFSVE
jgi:hypothetical protein